MMLHQEVVESRSFNSLGQGRNEPGMRSPENRFNEARPGAGLSAVALFFCFGVCLAFARPIPLFAQTAHCSAAMRTLSAKPSSPLFLAMDGSGNIYFTEYDSSAISEILAVDGIVPENPTIRTLASGAYNSQGIGVDGSGNVYFADADSGSVWEILAVGGVIPANPTVTQFESGFSLPEGIAVDGAGDVFVSDMDTSKVYEILRINGRDLALPIGSGFEEPKELALDGNGNLFVNDTEDYFIKVLAAQRGSTAVTTVLNETMDSIDAVGLAVDGNDNIFVGDFNSFTVKEILAAGGYSTIKTLGLGFGNPHGVAVDAKGGVFVVDWAHDTIYEILPIADFGTVSVGKADTFKIPLYFTFDTAGTLGSTAVGCVPDEAATAPQVSGRAHALRHRGDIPDPASPAHSGIRWGSSPPHPRTVGVRAQGSWPAGSPRPWATSAHCAITHRTSGSGSAASHSAASTPQRGSRRHVGRP